jgi:hypothetical protein
MDTDQTHWSIGIRRHCQAMLVLKPEQHVIAKLQIARVAPFRHDLDACLSTDLSACLDSPRFVREDQRPSLQLA